MFITIEGIDGSGKSTLAERAVAILKRKGLRTVWTYEPGGWDQGDSIRALLLGSKNLKNPLTEVMLFLSDRCEHIKHVIEPALQSGASVVCERYNDSTRAYQCWGRGIDRERMEQLIKWCAFPVPDLTVWLDIPVAAARQRVAGRGNFDRIEKEAFDFHCRVAAGFASLACEYPQRFVRLDAEKTPDELEDELRIILANRGMI